MFGWLSKGGFGSLGGVGGKKAAPLFATLNPLNKGANITLSGGNLIATNGANAFNSAGSTHSHSTGQFYFEAVETVGASNVVVGMANSSATAGNFYGSNLNSIGWISDGRVLVNSATIATIQTFAAGNTVCVAADLTNSKIWFRANGGNWNNDVIANQNPATNTGGVTLGGVNAGPYFPGVSAFPTGAVWTVNFGASAYAQAVPSGFGNW